MLVCFCMSLQLLRNHSMPLGVRSAKGYFRPVSDGRERWACRYRVLGRFISDSRICCLLLAKLASAIVPVRFSLCAGWWLACPFGFSIIWVFGSNSPSSGHTSLLRAAYTHQRLNVSRITHSLTLAAEAMQLSPSIR